MTGASTETGFVSPMTDGLIPPEEVPEYGAAPAVRFIFGDESGILPA